MRSRGRPAAGEVAGTQSIQRTLSVLRYVGSRASMGATLGGVVQNCGLSKATAHRMLSVLVVERFVRYDDEARRYALGNEAHVLGWASVAKGDLRSAAQPAMMRICEAWEDTTFLSIRSGSESICIDRHVGHYPVKTLTMEIGSRRPLGVGASSTALLAFLPEEEAEDVLAGLGPSLAPYPAFSTSVVRRLVAWTRRDGFSFNDEMLIPGVSSVGVPILGGRGEVLGAFSVAAITARMDPQRRADIVTMLKDEATSLCRVLQTGEERGSGRRGFSGVTQESKHGREQ